MRSIVILAFAATAAAASGLIATWGLTSAGATAAPGIAASHLVAPLEGPTSARPIAVFGHDDRVPLPQNLAALRGSIGLVSSPEARVVCTGFCVGRRTIATAAHCLFRTAGERPPQLAGFQFSTTDGHDKRTSHVTARHTGAHRQHVVAGSTTLRVTPPIDATRDWALVRLESPICEGRELAVAPRTPSAIAGLAARGRLLNAAFHGDRARDQRDWQLAVSRACTILQDLDRAARHRLEMDFSNIAALLLHQCDTGLASSGSPLLALGSDNRLEVVAMNIGTYQQTRYLLTDQAVRRRYKPATVANTAIAGTAFANAVLAFTRADILGEAAEIRRLQAALARSGFDPGPQDGVFGPMTRGALIEAERAAGRPDIGLATRQALNLLERGSR